MRIRIQRTCIGRVFKYYGEKLIGVIVYVKMNRNFQLEPGVSIDLFSQKYKEFRFNLSLVYVNNFKKSRDIVMKM